MNKQRKIGILQAIEKIGQISNSIEEIKNTEERAKEGIEDYPQFASRAIDMELAVDSLVEALSYLEKAIESLREAKNG